MIFEKWRVSGAVLLLSWRHVWLERVTRTQPACASHHLSSPATSRMDSLAKIRSYVKKILEETYNMEMSRPLSTTSQPGRLGLHYGFHQANRK